MAEDKPKLQAGGGLFPLRPAGIRCGQNVFSGYAAAG